jgi:hypothetical protein
MAGKLTKTQAEVLEKIRNGSVIGELSDKVNGRYELFTTTDIQGEFIIKKLNKNTVFALLTLGLIHIDNNVANNMRPYGRDYWYVNGMEAI